MSDAAPVARHPWFARAWALLGPLAASPHDRRALLEGLSGDVVEVGAGDGRNFAFYPAGVTSVLAVEPEPRMLDGARRRARRARVPVEVVSGTAEALPAPDDAFAAGVVSLVLCSVDDQARALAELRRVLRPGGELRFHEHVVSEEPRAAAVQRRLDARVWPALAGGCHLARDTLAAMDAAGFRIERVRRFTPGPGPLGVPHVAGAARLALAAGGRGGE